MNQFYYYYYLSLSTHIRQPASHRVTQNTHTVTHTLHVCMYMYTKYMCMYIQCMYTCTMYMSCMRVQILVLAMSACGMDGKRLDVKWSVWGIKTVIIIVITVISLERN